MPKTRRPPHVNVLFYGAKIAISPGENRSARKDRRRKRSTRPTSRLGMAGAHLSLRNEEEKRSPAYVPQPRDYGAARGGRCGPLNC